MHIISTVVLNPVGATEPYFSVKYDESVCLDLRGRGSTEPRFRTTVLAANSSLNLSISGNMKWLPNALLSTVSAIQFLLLE